MRHEMTATVLMEIQQEASTSNLGFICNVQYSIVESQSTSFCSSCVELVNSRCKHSYQNLEDNWRRRTNQIFKFDRQVHERNKLLVGPC